MSPVTHRMYVYACRAFFTFLGELVKTRKRCGGNTVRKVIGKQRLVKAIALSLAAIMTVVQPLTVFAESGDDYAYEEDVFFDENYTYDDFLDDCSEHVTDDAQAAANKVVEFVEEPVIQDVVAVKLDVTDADEAFDKAVNEAIDAIKGDEGVINLLETAEELHTKVVIESQAVVIGVEAATAVVGEVVESVNTTIDEAKTKAENLQAEMNKATTDADVQAVQEAFKELVDTAKEEVNAAVEEYETVVGYYEAAREEVKRLAEEYDKAIENASAKAEEAKKAMQEAQAKASELAKEVARVENELDAVATDAIKLMKEYENIIAEAAAAEKELGDKLNLVDELNESLEQLKSHGTIGNDMAEVASDLGYDLSFLKGLTLGEAIENLEERIAKASKDVEDARNRLEELKLEVKEIIEESEDVDPPVLPTDDGDDTTLPVVLPVVDPVVPVVVPQADPVVVAQEAPIVATTTQVSTPVLNAGEAAATIEDNQVPLVGEIVDEPEATVTIEDEEVPLAGSIPVDKTARNWWWLLLLVVAAVGYYTYRRYKNRQEA